MEVWRLFDHLLSHPKCRECGTVLRLEGERRIETLQPVFELTFACTRCGERTRRVMVCELFN